MAAAETTRPADRQRAGPSDGSRSGCSARPTRQVHIHRVEGSATAGPPAVHDRDRAARQRAARPGRAGFTDARRHARRAAGPTTPRRRPQGAGRRSGRPAPRRSAPAIRSQRTTLGHGRIGGDHPVGPVEDPPDDRPADPAARRRVEGASSAGDCHSATTSPRHAADRDRSVAGVNARGPCTTTTSAHFDSARTAPRAAKDLRPGAIAGTSCSRPPCGPGANAKVRTSRPRSDSERCSAIAARCGATTSVSPMNCSTRVGRDRSDTSGELDPLSPPRGRAAPPPWPGRRPR